MKKTVSLILACLLLLGLAACSNAPADTTPPADDTPAVDNPATPNEPTDEPADEPTNEPTDEPADEPTNEPTDEPADEPTEEPTDEPTDEPASELEGMMNTIMEGVSIETTMMGADISADRYYWFFGTETPIEGYEAYGYEPMIGSIPLSISILKVPEGTDAATVAADLEGTVDARKWICVEAENKIIKQNGQYVLVVLASSDIADAVSANFDAYFVG